LKFSSRVCIARADNERKYAMFPGFSGSIDYVFAIFVNAR